MKFFSFNIFDNKIIQMIKKNCNVEIIFVIIIVLSLQYLNLPGLYMDAVNPDYMAMHIKNSENVPLWGYTDNIFATLFLNKPYQYPILNSLYGMNYPAYILLLISFIFGNNMLTVRVVHILYSLGILFFCYLFIKRITHNAIWASGCLLLLGLNPTFLFAFRTQYYLQLFPHLFFIPGFLFMINGVSEKRRKIIFLASFLIGIAASSYFIFGGYYVAIFLIICIYCKEKKIKSAVNSILGFLIGYFPFIYTHFSILIQGGKFNYIEILKSLNVYGISEGQKSFLERLKHIIVQIGNLSGGNNIVKLITGRDITNTYRYYFNAIFIFIFIFIMSWVILFTEYIKCKDKFLESKNLLALISLNLIFIMHFILGLIIGTSLDYQHYIMLLPIMYMIIFLTIYIIYKKLFVINKKLYTFYFVSIGIIGIYSIFQIETIYKNINETKGIGMYSNVINDIGCYLENITTDKDVIICPQWGYWMGIAVITNGEKMIWNDTSPEVIIQKIKYTELIDKYYMVLDNNTNLELLNLILNETDVKIEEIISFYDYGDILNVKVILMH